MKNVLVSLCLLAGVSANADPFSPPGPCTPDANRHGFPSACVCPDNSVYDETRGLCFLRQPDPLECPPGSVELEIEPKQPAVVQTDSVLNPGTPEQRTIKAPWVRLELHFTNRTEKKLEPFFLYFLTGNREGKFNSYSLEPTLANLIQPGETRVEKVYVDDLPASAGTDYSFKARFYYFIGDKNTFEEIEFHTR
jgi:hypothetical protein